MPFGDRPDVVVILLSGSTEWTVPFSYDHNNSIIELIAGGGGGGGSGKAGTGAESAGSGAGGAGYSKVTNFDAAGEPIIFVSIGEAGPGGAGRSNGAPGGSTIWNNNPVVASMLIASGGQGGWRGKKGGTFGQPGGVGNVFTGGRGGNGEVTSPPGSYTGGGGGGSANASGSGQDGIRSLLGGTGGAAGAPIGFFWQDTEQPISASAGAGGTGNSGGPSQPGFDSGGGGAGGGKIHGTIENGGASGAGGFIVITYRNKSMEFIGHAVDEDTIIKSGVAIATSGHAIDDDSLQGQLLRQLILSGRSIDEDVAHGQSKTQFTLTGDIVDADILGGRPVFSFTLIGELADDAAVSAPLSRKTAFHGQALDNDEAKAYLAKIVNFSLTIAGDTDLSHAGPIVIGLVELAGTILDAAILSHIPVPPRDIAFFVIRDPVVIHPGPVLEEGFTNPNTLHGFGLKNLVVENMTFEIIPVNMKPDDDPTTTIFMESD